MNPEVSQPSTSEKTGIQAGLADRADALHAVNKAQETLGRVGSNALVSDGHGGFLTDREAAQERTFRKEHGHSSNETATSI